SGGSNLRKEQILLIFFLPIFGPLVAIAIEQMNFFKKQGTKPIDLDPLDQENEILWVTLKSFHENSDIVPLEEAILINDVKVRRRLMLETLYTDPLKYLDILNIAKYNDDIETSHYATTTIAKAQKDFQLSIQKLEVAVENDPDNVSLLEEYINAIEKYIQSGLLEEHLLRNLRIVYSKALDAKIRRSGDELTTYIRKIGNCVQLGEFNTAFEISDIMILNWPDNENTWIEAIRVCTESKDGFRLREITLKMKEQKIAWTKNGRERVKIWLEAS
ncbi:MAG TPA: hypothetical protein PKO16_02920, partial [Bacteroidia bacterium]|nr:hypothetical protein [Bacteroidia bacterium]